MANNHYVALKDVNIGGRLVAKGDKFEADSKSAHVATALHFKQIEVTKAKASSAEKPEQSDKSDKSEDKAPAK